MTAPFISGTKPKALSVPDKVLLAKRQPALATFLMREVAKELDALGDSVGVAAVEYFFDNVDDRRGRFDEIDAALADANLTERVSRSASYYPGNELPDDVFFSITGEAA